MGSDVSSFRAVHVRVYNANSAAEPVKLEETPLQALGVALHLRGRLPSVTLDTVRRQHEHVHLPASLDRILQLTVAASRQDLLQSIAGVQRKKSGLR